MQPTQPALVFPAPARPLHGLTSPPPHSQSLGEMVCVWGAGGNTQITEERTHTSLSSPLTLSARKQTWGELASPTTHPFYGKVRTGNLTTATCFNLLIFPAS